MRYSSNLGTMTRRRFAGRTGASIAAAALAARLPIPDYAYAQNDDPTPTPPPDREPGEGRDTVITFFSSLTGPDFEAFGKIAADYEASQPDIGVKISVSQGHAENPRLLTTLAAGDAPDVAMMADFHNAQYVELGVVSDLTDKFNEAGLTEEDFYPSAWQSMNYKDRIWHMPYEVDPNFPLFWNKTLFEEAGLDPEQGPETFEDLDAFNQAIMKEEDGTITQIGIIPWETYDPANSLFTWGFCRGASFYDEEKQEVTPDNDQAIETLEWMVKFAQDLGGPDRISIAPPNLGVHGMAAGRLGMAPLVMANFRDVLRYSPDLQLGQGLLPFGGQATAMGEGAWSGGWRLFIPTGAKNFDAAWDFIYWMTCTDEGSRSQYEHQGFPPGWTKAPINEEFKNDPDRAIYYDTLVNARNARPSIPVGAFYVGQLDEKVALAVYGEMEPRAAMEEVKQLTMNEWERFGR